MAPRASTALSRLACRAFALLLALLAAAAAAAAAILHPPVLERFLADGRLGGAERGLSSYAPSLAALLAAGLAAW
ncbi:MAG TPA: hypothetical protein VMS76_12690, partial [Planctomycetota bacterium]|nr:hypothetical protein [Planctomycetota bacterium]